MRKINPFKTAILQSERKWGLTVRSVEDILNESPHKEKYDEDGNLMYESVRYKGQTYIRETLHDVKSEIKTVGNWRLV